MDVTLVTETWVDPRFGEGGSGAPARAVPEHGRHRRGVQHIGRANLLSEVNTVQRPVHALTLPDFTACSGTVEDIKPFSCPAKFRAICCTTLGSNSGKIWN
jgi:hypothetical protein